MSGLLYSNENFVRRVVEEMRRLGHDWSWTAMRF
jgi:hypothetical protein